MSNHAVVPAMSDKNVNVVAIVLTLLAILIGFLLAAAVAKAADVSAGKKIADTWCASCHVTPAAVRGPDSAPPFSEIAARRALEPGELRGRLADPHPPMPKLHLSRQQVEDVAAYIRTLAPPR